MRKPSRRRISTSGGKAVEPGIGSGTRARPALPDARSVDSVLLEYLNKPTAPGMDAVRLEQLAGEPLVLPDARPADHDAPHSGPARPSLSPEDERPTGRFSTPTKANPGDHVRDRGVLVRIDGESSGEVVPLPRSSVLVGRSSSAHVHIVESSVSREHARIVYDNGVYKIEDLGSHNGTEVSGRRVTRAELRDGDLLRVGQLATFRFQLMDQAQEDVMRRLYDSSMRDPLTGADNRRSLDSRVLAEIAFAKRHKRPLSVILLDIDFFKRVNDRHGHHAGDEVLRTVAATIRGQLRTEDVFARYGGEEFAILLRDTALAEAVYVAERVRERIGRTPVSVDGVDIDVTLSGGCSSLACCLGITSEELIGVADRRLYRAKRSGRNRIAGRDDA
jgi:diguanylate cyclase (GGDEF)-like protein